MDELNTPMVMPPEESIPDWYDGNASTKCCLSAVLKKHPMKCVRGRLFTVDGLIEDEAQIGNLILEEISGCLTSGLSKVVANLLASIKLQAYSPPCPSRLTVSMWQTGHSFWMGVSPRTKAIATTV